MFKQTTNPAIFQFSFSHITIFPFLFIPSVAPPCVVQGAKLRTGPLKICKPASRPAGFGENFSIRPAGRLKIFHQKPCIFSPRPYLPPETSKVRPPTRHKKKVNVMKKRTEIQQDLKRGFGSAPTGIKNLVKWLSVDLRLMLVLRLCRFYASSTSCRRALRGTGNRPTPPGLRPPRQSPRCTCICGPCRLCGS